MTKFEQMARLLTQYEQKVGDDGTIYYLRQDGCVGYRRNNLIVLYFQCHKDVIWNHWNLVKVGIAKDFQLVKWHKNGYKEKKVEIVVVKGFCGAANALDNVNNNYIKSSVAHDIFEKEVAIGNTTEKGHFEAYDGSFEIIVPHSMCNYNDTDSIDYSVLRTLKKPRRKKEEYTFTRDLIKENEWFYTHGFNTAGSAETRARMEATWMQNYHKLAGAKIRFK